MEEDKLYCTYCNEEILNKKRDSRKTEGKRYHIKCVRKLRKELEIMKNQGKIKPGQEHKVATKINS